MKKIFIPESKEDEINIYDIHPDFKGIILVYKDNYCRGYIVYNDDADAWCLFNSINIPNTVMDSDELIDIIRYYPEYEYRIIELTGKF